MDKKEKLRVLLQHWIDHNIGHAEEFAKWRQIANEEGETAVATSIAEAISAINSANAALAKALEHTGGTPHADNTCHHHHHHHH